MTEGLHESYWIDSTPDTSYDELPAGLTVDVAVLGGGIAGLTTAVLLKRAGKTVAVVEADRIVKGVTGYTTAKVTSQHNLIYDYLVGAFGDDGARIYGESQQAAIERVAAFVADEGIDCDFRRLPHYVYSEVADERSALESEAATAARLGLPATFVEETPLPYPVVGAVRFDNQAQFHPRKYLLALAQTIPGDGSFVIEGTRATGVDEGEQIVVQTERGEIRARDVVVATHMPILDRGLYFAKAAPYRDHVVAAAMPAASVPDGMFISTGAEEFSTHSVRSTPYRDGQALLIVSGTPYKTGEDEDTEAKYAHLTEWTKARFGVSAIDYRWSTQDNSSVDRVPFIGKLRRGNDHLWVATGFSAWGMTNGTLSGMLLSDAILGIDNPWASLYDPNRLDVSNQFKKLVKENLKVAKHFVGDRLSVPKIRDVEDLEPGEAAIVMNGVQHTAVYRDDGGALHAVSAVCAHMGCLVGWNNGEKSWDCPCHGSRYDVDGHVLQGPAVHDLEPREV